MGKKKQAEKIERDDRIEFEGVVTDSLPGTLFEVTLKGGATVLCTLGGKLHQNHIRVLTGDRVRIHVSPYDLSRGRVIFRLS